MNKSIYIDDWLKLKPYNKESITDGYYLSISNEVLKVLSGNEINFYKEFLVYEEIKMLACFLTAYFEDIISETRLWITFTRQHHALYGKKIPFYLLDEKYIEGEINQEDIYVLIWYFISSLNPESLVSPYYEFIQITANRIMDIFERNFEYAPENKHLQTFYQLNKNEKDFYKVRKLIENLFFKSYLFFPDIALNFNEMIDDIIETSKEEENEDPHILMQKINELLDLTLHHSHSRLLAMRGKDWAAALLGNKKPVSQDLAEMSKKIYGFFLYKGQDAQNVILEHIASSKKFKLTKRSFNFSNQLKKINSIVYIGMVKWRNEWWFSGQFGHSDFDIKLVNKEKKSKSSFMAVNFLDHQEGETEEILKFQLNVFMKIKQGYPIAFMPYSKIWKFTKKFWDNYTDAMNLTEDQKIKTKNLRHVSELIRDQDGIEMDPELKNAKALIFFNPKMGIEILYGLCETFPHEKNPYFKGKEDKHDILYILNNPEVSTELAYFFLEQARHKLPFFTKKMGKKLIDDIDFLLRFWKSNNYHTVPSISFFGDPPDQDQKFW